jgi:hypothetical protein
LVLLPALSWGWLEEACACAVWLAFLWLVISWAEGLPSLFAGFQAVLSLAVVLGSTAWLKHQSWVAETWEGLVHPWSLQAYGIGLAGLAFVWLGARLGLRGSERARVLLEPQGLACDRAILRGVLVGQMVFPIVAIFLEVVAEIWNEPACRLMGPEWSAQVFGPGAWILLLLLAGVMVGNIWCGGKQEPILDLGRLTLLAPVLLAGGVFRPDQAVVPALCWGLAACFLGWSLLLWLRNRLARWGDLLQIPSSAIQAESLRHLILRAAAAPVVLMIFLIFLRRFGGENVARPVPDSLFDHIGRLASFILPLGLISAGLAGSGFRERFPRYLFAAGWLGVGALTGGYALMTIRHAGALHIVHWVTLLQLGGLAAGLWTIVWLLIGDRLSLTFEGPSLLHTPLMVHHMVLGGSLVAFLLLMAACGLVLTVFSRWQLQEVDLLRNWPAEAGSRLGWPALIIPIAGIAGWQVHSGKKVSALLVGITELATILLLACSVERWFPGQGYRCLMLGLGVGALGLAWMAGRLQSATLPTDLGGSGPIIALIILVLPGVTLLALAAAAAADDHLFSAVAMVLVGSAAVVGALQFRREPWSLTAGLGFLLAVSLMVWWANRLDPLEDWLLWLVQANLITAAVLAWLGLTLRHRLYPQPDLSFSSSPLLAGWISLALLVNVLLLVEPLFELLVNPGAIGEELAEKAQAGGWLALVLSLAAGLRYGRLAKPGLTVHILGGGGLLVGVLAACTAGAWDRGDWLAQHVLTTAWAVWGLGMLAAAWAGNSLQQLGPLLWSPERRARAAQTLASFFPDHAARHWVTAYGLLVAGLALRGAWGDPASPWWASAATLAAAGLVGALAVWLRQPFYVYVSGSFLNLIGFSIWKALVLDRVADGGAFPSNADLLGSFLYTQVLCLGLGSVLWTTLEMLLRRRHPPLDLRRQWVPFAQAAALLGLHVLIFQLGLGLASDLAGLPTFHDGVLAWWALGGIGLALLIGLWDAGQRSVAPLYVWGLVAAGLALHALSLAPDRLGWAAASVLAAYVLLNMLLIAKVPWQKIRSSLRLPEVPENGTPTWLLPAQALLAATAFVLSLWMSLGFERVLDRLGGPLVSALLLAAAIVLAGCWSRLIPRLNTTSQIQKLLSASRLPWFLGLGLGLVLGVEICWALIDPADLEPWLQRCGLMVTVVFLTAAAYGLGLPRIFPNTDWSQCGVAVANRLFGLACLLQLLFVGQELAFYDPQTRTCPLIWPAAVLVGLSQVGLLAGALHLAVTRVLLPEPRRRLLVYVAEGFLVLLFMHVRLNKPDFIPPILGRYWPLAVMALAFAGVGLSVFLERKGLGVVSEPLQRTGILLPLLPVLAFLFQPLAPVAAAWTEAAPGLQPFVRYLERLPAHYGQHALIWLLVGLLYAFLALSRRSSGFALLAALAVNFAGWVVWGHHERLGFVAHPQLWLIPLGLIVLAAEFWNCPRLTFAQCLTLRYLGLLLIYLSSTADMFIAGLGESVLLPIVLAVLSILGVMAGILLRIRAFLLLGVSFLFLVIFAQIWHAAVDRAQTWVWWASGFVLGVIILTVFAFFEKHRNELVKVIEDMKRWH